MDFKSNNLCVIEVQAVSINLVSLKKKIWHSLFSNYTHFYTKFPIFRGSKVSWLTDSSFMAI